MNSGKEELEYEEKMDQISEYIEELMLDAILSALQKIKARYLLFSVPSKTCREVDIQF